jgi:hypothetical protein
VSSSHVGEYPPAKIMPVAPPAESQRGILRSGGGWVCRPEPSAEGCDPLREGTSKARCINGEAEAWLQASGQTNSESGAKFGSIELAHLGLPTCTRTQRGRTETGSHSANPPTNTTPQNWLHSALRPQKKPRQGIAGLSCASKGTCRLRRARRERYRGNGLRHRRQATDETPSRAVGFCVGWPTQAATKSPARERG